MIKGWWLAGADTTLDEVVDTAGMVFRITGEYEDGSLELQVVYDADGFMPMERWGAKPDISSNYEPVPYDPPYEPIGIAVLGGDDE